MDAGDGGTPSIIAHPPSEELVARAIAPIKPEFLCPPPVRSAPDAAADDGGEGGGDASSGSSKSAVKEKKSKRQLKRERVQDKKSNVCTEVAKTGKVDACPYGSSCRFNHDVDAYLALKADDLDGTCPFVSLEQQCPYGLTCRFFGTHKDSSELLKNNSKNSEINHFRKDLQKLLWKNKVKFPKADAQLKLLGLKLGGTRQNLPSDTAEMPCDNLESQVIGDAEADKLLCSTTEGEDEGKQKFVCSITDCESDANTKLNCSTDGGNEANTKLFCCTTEDVKCSSVRIVGDGSEDIANLSASSCNDIRPLKKAKSDLDCSENGTSNGLICEQMETIADVNKNGEEKYSAKSSAYDSSSCNEDLREKKIIDFRGKLYLAPLTTVGNLPFRRTCKMLGADITCGEMAMCTNLLQGHASEWALLRRHPSEDLFGVQICGAYPDTVARTVELIDQECSVDFIDINMGCPIDIVVNKGAGSSLLSKPMRMKSIIQASSNISSKPLTVKVRTGFFEGKNRIHSLVSDIYDWGAVALTIHGRTRQQRYSKLADWNYINQCAQKSPAGLNVIGNGDVFSFNDWNKHLSESPGLSTCMIARGALIKPWIFTEIKEQRHWDITSEERLNILKKFVNFGLEHWGSDTKGVETTRHFLLEWLSYTYRYIPVGLLDVIPQRLNWRPPSYCGRNDLETLMASDSAADWIRISEMLLGKVPEGFTFAPKHKSNAYDRAENG